jgi:hypothetical protein
VDIGESDSEAVPEAKMGSTNDLSESPSDVGRWRRAAGDESGDKTTKATMREVARSSIIDHRAFDRGRQRLVAARRWLPVHAVHFIASIILFLATATDIR